VKRTSGVVAVATGLQRLQQQLARPPRLLPLPMPLLLPLPLPLPLPELLARHRLRLQPRLRNKTRRDPPSGSTQRAVTAALAAVALHGTASGCCAEPSVHAVRPRRVRMLRRRALGQVQGQAWMRARVARVRRVRAEEWMLVRRARLTQTRPPPPLPPLAHQRGG
jgi:hypothetical protein